ncbi:MAG: glutathione S-transferase family protein [Rhodocyclaceae bacterium]|nr:glutathione S-transferase family protein [Rhodocyclaceae bacterium]
MPITFYYGSGSPYSWRVWLALEHKSIPFELKLLSFGAGDHLKPEFLAINPRHKVPALVDEGFAIYESAAIVDYLEDAYPFHPLLPRELRARATARRMIREADGYLAEALERMVAQILFTPKEQWDDAVIDAARGSFAEELGRFESMLTGDWFAGELGAVDYTIFPLIALARRMELRRPQLDWNCALGPKLAAWIERFQALPVCSKTWPPHWKS